ncbi:MAG: hypothetical protein K0U66_01040, partial [Gammaproteobacteria bacterium]|nr:hypothetical protein [Gammaproteobacteria bacterium]
MNVTVKRETAVKAKVDVLIIPVSQDAPLAVDSPAAQLDVQLEGLISDYMDSGDFSAELNQTALLRTRGNVPAPRALLVGLGKPEAFTPDHLRQACASAATTARKLGVATIGMLLPSCDLPPIDTAQAMVEGSLMGLYT